MDHLVTPGQRLRPRQSRLAAVGLAIAVCALVALVAVRRGDQPATVLASDSTIAADTIFEHAGDSGDGAPASLGDAAIAFGDKKSLIIEDHKEINSLKSEVKSLEAEVDLLHAKIEKPGRKGKIVVNVAVGAPGPAGEMGPMGPVRQSARSSHLAVFCNA
jgi:hypothetical protein